MAPVQQVNTYSDGSFMVVAMEPGRYRLKVSAHEEFISHETELMSLAVGTEELLPDIRLEKGAGIEGLIRSLLDALRDDRAHLLQLLQRFAALVGLGNLATQCDDRRDLLVAQWGHALLASHRLLDVGRQLFQLLELTLFGLCLELRHHFRREQLERFADVLVLVAAPLLDERHLVDTRVRETAKMLA